ncbi:restriction endonuclease subunit S, partial [Avibacterium avium]
MNSLHKGEPWKKRLGRVWGFKMKFTNYKLNDLGKIITGKTPPSKVQNAFTQVGIPFVTPSDMNGGRFVEKTNRNLSDEGLNVVRNNLIPENSVAVSCIGSDMGKAIIIKTTSVTNQQINSIIVNEKFNYLYIYYVLSTKQQELKNIASGSATPILNKTQFGNIEIKLPDRKYQDKVSNILDKFDNKIELNTQTNQTLEQIAQAIFKHWFIDFAPVHAKANALARGETIEQAELAAMACLSGKTVEKITALKTQDPTTYHQLQQTAAAFPSEFVESGMGLVPKGWEVTTIGNIADIIKGKSYKSSELEPSDTALVTLKSFQRGGGYRLDGLKEFSGKYKPEQEVYVGELIIAYTDVTQAADIIGKPAMVMGNKKYKHLVISLDVGVVRPKDKDLKYFLYCLAMTENFQQHTKSFCSGTTVLHLGKNAIPSFQFIMPDTQLLKELNKRLEPIFTKININIQENESLSETRDILLPKLL